MNEKKVYRCPACGHIVPIGSPICSNCGTVFKQEDIGRYSVELEKVLAEKDKDLRRYKTTAIISIVVAIFIAILMFIALLPDLQNNIEDRRLIALTEEVQELILNDDLNTALVKVQSIRVEKNGLFDQRYDRWESQRNDLLKLIKEKQK